jgi:hypothetical protein
MFRVVALVIAAAIVPWASVTSVLGKSNVNGKCVCEAAQIKSSRSIVVRGTGIFTRDEPILFDFGCPIADFTSGRMPSVIMLEITSFASDSDREKFDSLKSYLDLDTYDQAVFQLVVRGSIECKAKVTIEPMSDGAPGFGDAFGSEGTYKCKLTNGKVLSFKEIVRPEKTIHSRPRTD